jgi:hypothetical protein
MYLNFGVPPPDCGRSVSDFWGWEAHEAQLRCPDEVDGDTWIWSTRRGLNLSSTKLTRPWSPWESSHSRKNPNGRTGNRTRDLMISSQKLWPLDHKTGQLMSKVHQELLARFFLKRSKPWEALKTVKCYSCVMTNVIHKFLIYLSIYLWNCIMANDYVGHYTISFQNARSFQHKI